MAMAKMEVFINFAVVYFSKCFRFGDFQVFFAYYYVFRVYFTSSKLKSHNEVTKQYKLRFFLCLKMEGSGSGRSENKWIRIHNTAG
jgi:hypothetical protein